MIPGVVSTGIIFAFTYFVHTFFALYSPFYTLSPSSPQPHWCQPSPLGRTYSALLFSDFVGEKKEKR
jgi:hypothetical protein